MKLGIAVTTFNRRAMVLALIDTLRELTSCPFDLIVCDDGSSDGTAVALRARGINVLGAVNRGIAWNKNRGLFYLREILAVDVILLLDDDVLPVRAGWEQQWIAAVERHGHVNYLPFGDPGSSGAGTPEDPSVSEKLWGQCIAFSRRALSYVGYMDTRFKGYGHEHTELTLRAIRAGFGGFARLEAGRPRRFFYGIEGGIRVLPGESFFDAGTVAENGKILEVSDSEPIYRNAWRGDTEYQALRGELAALDGVTKPVSAVAPPRPAAEAPGRNLAHGRPATQSSTSQWSRGATPEEDAAGAVSGRANGRRNFTTGAGLAPWWQVDLGEAKAVAEIRIYNTLEAEFAAAFTGFVLAIAFDPEDWIEVCRKDDDDMVGGADGNPFVWKPSLSAFARFVRITLIGEGALHLDQVEVFGPGQSDTVQRLDAEQPDDAGSEAASSDAALFSRFISLGDNCEFGMVQRRAGLEPLDLLRFGGTGEDEAGLILAMEEHFVAFGTLEDLRLTADGDEWIAWSHRYGVSFHTHRKTKTFSHQQMVFEMSKRLRLMAGKLVEDLVAGEKIFVRKSNKPVTAETMFTLKRAMAGYGNPVLLWVEVDQREHATVNELAPGFLHGSIRRLAPYEDATDVRLEDWRTLCHAVLARVEAGRRPDVLAAQAAPAGHDAARNWAVNLARDKPATQSSVSPWSRDGHAGADAAGAVDGKPSGTWKFHTDLEEAPWWQVDLGHAQAIAAIRIYNVVDPAVRRRFERFQISVAFEPDGEWIEIYRKDDDEEVGGVDGKPFFWRPELPAFARLVRVTAAGRCFLHLDQVEIFGPGMTDAPVRL